MKFVPNKEGKKDIFWYDNVIDIRKLDEEIKNALGFIRWEDNPKKEGYSGISLVEDENWQEKGKPAKYSVVVHWTLNGRDGFDIKFDSANFEKVKKTIENHNK